MEINLGTKHLAADAIVSADQAGREHLVVVAKASWTIPSEGGRPRPLPPQPLAYADQFYDGAETAALRYGDDFARYKPQCDVIFDACAHAPGGKPVTDIEVGFNVGKLQKRLRVVGERRWSKFVGVTTPTKPSPFVSMPLHYGYAFGGTRTYRQGWGSQRHELAEALRDNPDGRGWAGPKTAADVHDLPLPSLLPLGSDVRSPRAKSTPIALSAVARHWHVRAVHAGTYDEAWSTNVSPFLPEDFDDRFYQCAPPDQRMAYPTGGEEVVLMHMMAQRPLVKFRLPDLSRMKVQIMRTDHSVEVPRVVADTVYFQPDEQRFSVVWRCSVLVRRRVREFKHIAVGSVDPAWWMARVLGQPGDECVGCGRGQSS